jgi:hypothetical protein
MRIFLFVLLSLFVSYGASAQPAPTTRTLASLVAEGFEVKPAGPLFWLQKGTTAWICGSEQQPSRQIPLGVFIGSLPCQPVRER